MANIKYTKEDKLAVLDGLKDSGLSINKYCKEIGVARSDYYKWLREIENIQVEEQVENIQDEITQDEITQDEPFEEEYLDIDQIIENIQDEITHRLVYEERYDAIEPAEKLHVKTVENLQDEESNDEDESDEKAVKTDIEFTMDLVRRLKQKILVGAY